MRCNAANFLSLVVPGLSAASVWLLVSTGLGVPRKFYKKHCLVVSSSNLNYITNSPTLSVQIVCSEKT